MWETQTLIREVAMTLLSDGEATSILPRWAPVLTGRLCLDYNRYEEIKVGWVDVAYGNEA
jgi:hypothetical protein